jgi:hypothetical protein
MLRKVIIGCIDGLHCPAESARIPSMLYMAFQRMAWEFVRLPLQIYFVRNEDGSTVRFVHHNPNVILWNTNYVWITYRQISVALDIKVTI